MLLKIKCNCELLHLKTPLDTSKMIQFGMPGSACSSMFSHYFRSTQLARKQHVTRILENFGKCDNSIQFFLLVFKRQFYGK